jgi:hypothetical protein
MLEVGAIGRDFSSPTASREEKEKTRGHSFPPSLYRIPPASGFPNMSDQTKNNKSVIFFLKKFSQTAIFKPWGDNVYEKGN